MAEQERLAKSHDRWRHPKRIAAILAMAGLAISSAGAAPLKRTNYYDLYKSFPNYNQVAQGNYLDGVNPYDPNVTDPDAPHPAHLWFQNEGNDTFKMYNTSPGDQSHWDQYHWTSGNKAALVYTQTHSESSTGTTDVVIKSGVHFVPRTWEKGQKWAQSGKSGTLYFEAGTAVCQGILTWSSRVVGEEKLSYVAGGKVLHALTNEYQTWRAIDGAPQSPVCPPGQVVKQQSRENFYYGDLPIRDASGNVTGYDWGLARSVGGNLLFRTENGHPEWDSQFKLGWNPMAEPNPPAL